MDLRTLLNKLDKLDSHQVLMESNTIREEILSTEMQLLKEAYAVLMERVLKRELDALRNVGDLELRKNKLAALASKNGYPGIFDPITGKWVDNQGNFAYFGPYKDEVQKMVDDGIVPLEAQTSAFWGIMGMDKAEAIKASTANASRFELIDGADEIIDKANQSKPAMDESFAKGSLARALTEDFGYSSNYLIEAISTTEHLKLKAYIEKLNNPEYKDDGEVQKVIFKYQEYVKYRDLLIAKIKEALERFKAKRIPAPAPAPAVNGLQPDANQSSAEVERLKRQNASLNESRGALREEFYIVPHKDNTSSVVHFYLDESGNVVGYVVTEDIEALGRGALDGLTFGWGDNAVAGIISMYKGTPYGAELIKQIKASEEAKSRAPVWYYGGMIAGGAGWGGTSLAGNLAAAGVNVASDFVRTPVNDKIKQQYKDDQAKKLKKVQGTVGAEPTGVPDANTVNAVKTKAAPVTAKANTPAPTGDMAEIFTAFGAKDMNGVFAKLKSQGVKTIEQLGDAVGKALKIEPMTVVKTASAPVAESITYSSMSESERMAYLRNRLNNIEQSSQLDEAIPGVGTGIKTGLEWLFGGVGRLFGGGGAAVIKGLAGIEKVFGVGVKEIALPGTGALKQIWKLETTGVNAGKWSTVVTRGRVRTRVFKTADEIATDLKNALHSGFVPKARPGQPTLPAAPPSGWVNPGSQVASAELNGVKYIKDADGKWYMKNSSTGVHVPVVDRAVLQSLEQGAIRTGLLGQLAAKYPKLAAGFRGVGSILKFGWNNKWWVALAAIIGAGYWAWSNRPEEPPVPPEELPPGTDAEAEPGGLPLGPGGLEGGIPPNADGTCKDGYTLDPVKKLCMPDKKVPGEQDVKKVSPEVQQLADNLRKLLQQLKDMYPADKETRDIEAEVEDALKGIPVRSSAQEVDPKAKPNNRYNF